MSSFILVSTTLICNLVREVIVEQFSNNTIVARLPASVGNLKDEIYFPAMKDNSYKISVVEKSVDISAT